MKTSTIVFLIIAAVLVIIGALIFTSALFAADFDFNKLSSEKFETNTYTADGNFENIEIECETADVMFKASADGNCRVECNENEKLKHTVTVKDGILRVSANDERKWYDHITFFGSRKASVIVYLPETSYASLSIGITTGDVHLPRGFEFGSVMIDGTTGDVEIASEIINTLDVRSTTGDTRISDVSAGDIILSVTTGDIEADNVKADGDFTFKLTTGEVEMDNVTCKNFDGKGSTGDVVLENVIAKEKLSVKTGTGDVIFEDCDADEIYVKTTTGHVKGTLLSAKVFLADTSTGKVDVPKTTSGGKCEITTTTGDVRIKVK